MHTWIAPGEGDGFKRKVRMGVTVGGGGGGGGLAVSKEK